MRPKLITPVLTGFLGVVCLLIVLFDVAKTPFWRWIWGAAALFLFVWAALTTLEWLTDLAATYQYRLAEARAVTPKSEMLRQINMLEPYHIEALMLGIVGIQADVTLAGAIPFYRLGPLKLPPWFVEQFFDACTEFELYPVRNYSDGIQRRWAEGLTAWFVQERLANEARGNRSATWRYGKETATRRFQIAQAAPEPDAE